jgi:hypothetical protein
VSVRALRLADVEAAAFEERERAILALMPPGMPQDRAEAWRWFAALYAKDPPAWRPSPRFAVLIDELCAERILIAGYRSALRTPAAHVYREQAGEAERAKINPYVPLLDAALRRELKLLGVLGMLPDSPRNMF